MGIAHLLVKKRGRNQWFLVGKELTLLVRELGLARVPSIHLPVGRRRDSLHVGVLAHSFLGVELGLTRMHLLVVIRLLVGRLLLRVLSWVS